MSTRNPLDIAFGYASGFKVVSAAGFRSGITNSGWDMIGAGLLDVATTLVADSNRIHLLDAPGDLSITAADVGDTGQVVVTYLDANWYERVTLYSLAGGSPVTQDIGNNTISARRVNGLRYIPGNNAGQIDALIGGNLAYRIATGDGIGSVCLYTVPRGQKVIITGAIAAAEATKTIELILFIKIPGSEPYVYRRIPARETIESFDIPIPRRVQAVDFSDPQNPTTIDHGIDLFAVARHPTVMSTADVFVSLSFLVQMTGDDPAAPGFSESLSTG